MTAPDTIVLIHGFWVTPRRVTTFYPGGMDTNLYENAGMDLDASHGQAWMMSPRRVAAAVAFVLSVPPDTIVSRLTIGPNLART